MTLILPAPAEAIDTDANSIPTISKSRRPMDSVPSLGTAPVDATPCERMRFDRLSCVKTGRTMCDPSRPWAHAMRGPGREAIQAAV